MMNPCCQRQGNAQIVESSKPDILWRVSCRFCGLVLHEQRRFDDGD